MEWWKLFGGTFILIFLAELGDKTQLAAMAKTADSPGGSFAKWVVFLGASLALVASTFIAVFLGHILKSLVPDERYIKFAAGTLFLIFGFKILYDTWSSYQTSPAGAAVPAVVLDEGEPGLAGGLALRAAMEFEALTMERYRRLAGDASPALAKVLLELAGEEERHLSRLRNLPETERADAVWSGAGPSPEVAGGSIAPPPGASAAGALAQLVEHEEATAAFYRDLAARTLIPSVRSVLSRLAEEETGHAGRLREAAGELSRG